ncbi:hypothetical protein FisN_9Hu231 [Fistulifera solaris]|jgi:broad specificity phosphatase PhoE|uniref:Uncharacterized protein n=1 Tax=Fistulifera solaris TaxID=1519565 RepID=A0A1Z5JAX6_FISSO|nr:hypothetical protein FisN_9Hu231 [Fistulifera solaris]|eukprot:GAX11140.1 hypothetical protein FisN_9Hu231 [Fistulifera solaris]
MTGRVQIVVFMRHGIAVHNVRDSRNHSAPDHRDVRFWDPPLVYQGVVRAVEAGIHVQRWMQEHTKLRRIELFVTSPLTRCIQTTTLAFLRGNDYEHPPPPIVCVEDVREAYGIYYPDKRREKSKLKVSAADLVAIRCHRVVFTDVAFVKSVWPQVEFSESMTEHDDDWNEDRRENFADVNARVDRFLAWLVHRPESQIVVVTHGVWMESLFRVHCSTALREDQRVHNCDAFACEIVSKDGVFQQIGRTQHISGFSHH